MVMLPPKPSSRLLLDSSSSPTWQHQQQLSRESTTRPLPHRSSSRPAWPQRRRQ